VEHTPLAAPGHVTVIRLPRRDDPNDEHISRIAAALEQFDAALRPSIDAGAVVVDILLVAGAPKATLAARCDALDQQNRALEGTA
jgi:hypothetical protein